MARQQAIAARFEGISDLRARGVHVFMTREEWEGESEREIFDCSFLSPRDVDRQLAELGLGLRRDQAWDFDISFLSPRNVVYHPTLNPAPFLNRSRSHEFRSLECESATASKTLGRH